MIATLNFTMKLLPKNFRLIKEELWKNNFPDFIDLNQWPPNSPDLNPLDYSVWSVLESKACSKPHRDIDSLKEALQKAWDEIDATYLRDTVEVFPVRLKACVAADGGIFEN